MKIYSELFETLIGLLFIIWWCAGIVYAKGLLTLVAILFPPYAMYLVVENTMKVSGLV